MAFNGPEIGDMRHRVRIQQLAAGQDDYGQPGNSWSDVATVWASIEELSGAELVAAQSIRQDVNTRITIRYRQSLDPRMRIAWGTLLYNVGSILDPTGRKRILQLMCSRGLSDAYDTGVIP